MIGEIAFWDSSALTPLFIEQGASQWARLQARRFSPVVWWGTRVEIRSAMLRVHRDGALNEPAKSMAVERLRAMHCDWYEVAPSDEVREGAESLLERYPLRAADSLQLAAALVWCRNRPKGRNFLSADAKLSEAAGQMGFTVLAP